MTILVLQQNNVCSSLLSGWPFSACNFASCRASFIISVLYIQSLGCPKFAGPNTLGILLLSLSVSEVQFVKCTQERALMRVVGEIPRGGASVESPTLCWLKGRKQAQVSGSLLGWGWHCPPLPWGNCKDKALQALPGYLHLVHDFFFDGRTRFHTG